jgi:hypothetical protein
MVFFDIIVDEIEFISVLFDKAPVRLIVQHFVVVVPENPVVFNTTRKGPDKPSVPIMTVFVPIVTKYT